MKVENYQIQYFAGGIKQSLKAFIWLYNEDNDAVGSMRFYNHNRDVPDHDVKAKDDFITCHLPGDCYREVVDLLRNEGPLFLKYEESHHTGYLSTTFEPVGEGEWHGEKRKI